MENNNPQKLMAQAKNMLKQANSMMKTLDALVDDSMSNLDPQKAKEFAEAMKNANVNERINEMKELYQKISANIQRTK